jgi:hypothetical protein
LGKCNIYEAFTTETHLGMLTVEGFATVRKKLPQAFRQVFLSCTSHHIPSVKNSLGSCIYHRTTALYTSLSDVNVRRLRASVIQRCEDCMAVSPGCIQDV